MDIPYVELDEYRMLDLTQDTEAQLLKEGYEPPEFFGFMFGCPGGNKRKLPLMSNDDWAHLANIWNFAKGLIPIHMLATPAPSKRQTIISELEAAQGRQSQTGLEVESPQILKSPLENAPSLSDSDEDDVDILGE